MKVMRRVRGAALRRKKTQKMESELRILRKGSPIRLSDRVRWERPLYVGPRKKEWKQGERGDDSGVSSRSVKGHLAWPGHESP